LKRKTESSRLTPDANKISLNIDDHSPTSSFTVTATMTNPMMKNEEKQVFQAPSSICKLMLSSR
jgi:hypothetical protein